MRTVLLVVAACVADAAGDVDVCQTLGTLPGYASVVEKTLTAKLGATVYGIQFGNEILGPVCAGQARIRGAKVYDAGVVATAASGTAVRFSPTYEEISEGRNQVDGDVVTGGGAVKDIAAINDFSGVVDTSGAHPALAPCRQAQAEARAAAARFASLAPTQVLHDVHVHPGEEVAIGGDDQVIQIDNLRVDGGETNTTCTRDYYLHGPGTLELTGTNTVINVTGRVQFGSCVLVYWDGEILLNVVGKGPSIRIGIGAYSPPAILAPDRTLVVTGTPDEDATFYYGWFGKLLVSGYTLTEPLICGH